jgi:hypothetical protein
VYKVDTIGRRLNKRALNLQSIGNFMDSRWRNYTAYKAKFQKSETETVDVILFGQETGYGNFDNTLELNQSLAQEFLDHWAVGK